MLKIFAVESERSERHEAARRILEWKYEEIWNKPQPDIQIGEFGKPHFGNAEEYFSFSYTEGLAFCAISDGEIGLDVEKVRSVSSAAISKVLSREEWLYYSGSSNPAEAFMRFWTLKEAYCKFTGQGIAQQSLKDLVFDLSGDHPVLLSRQDLRFWCRCIGDVVISVCADRAHRPELYSLELM